MLIFGRFSRIKPFKCYLVVAAVLTLIPCLAFSGGGEHQDLVSAKINLQDRESLQRGAQLYVNHCLGCHSLKYLRYERIADDLKIDHDIIKDQLILDGSKIGDPVLSAMAAEDAEKWFGVAPPDLSLEARLRGPDWVYSYLIAFYPDASRVWGVNNTVFPAVGMPHVLQGMQTSLDEDSFSAKMRDLTQFLTYAAEPVKLKRERIGRYVLIFLVILMIPVYFLNKEYWKDVK